MSFERMTISIHSSIVLFSSKHFCCCCSVLSGLQLVLIDKDIELVVDICGQFSANAQLHTVTQLVIFLQKLLSAHSQGNVDV